MSTDPTPTTPPRRTPSDDEVPSLLEALGASGGSTAAFAREHGLTPWKLYKAQRVAGANPQRRRRGKAAPEFVPVTIVEERAPPPGPLELVLGSGYRLLIPSGFDETTLRRVVGILVSC
jgi:hypothetical protein